MVSQVGGRCWNAIPEGSDFKRSRGRRERPKLSDEDGAPSGKRKRAKAASVTPSGDDDDQERDSVSLSRCSIAPSSQRHHRNVVRPRRKTLQDQSRRMMKKVFNECFKAVVG